MRASVNTAALLFAATFLQIAPCVAVAEEEGKRSERTAQAGHDRWIPSVSMITGLSVTRWRGVSASEICPGCTIPDPAMEALRIPTQGDDFDVTPYIGVNFELMTPELRLRGSPRFFVGTEVAAAFGFERIVAGEGDPNVPRSPLPEGAIFTPYGEDVVLGQGSKTTAQLDTLTYGIYTGVAFPVEILGRPVRIKPYFSWTHLRINVQGLVVDVECQPGAGSVTQCNTNLPNGFQRNIRLQGKDTDTYNGLGGGVDLEMDTGRFGRLGSSLFIGGRGYYIIGQRTIEFGDSQFYSDILGDDQTAAQWGFQLEPWSFRLVLGMRVQWLGSKN